MIKNTPHANTYSKLFTAFLFSLSFFTNVSYADALTSSMDPPAAQESKTKITAKAQFTDTINVNNADAGALAQALKGVGARKAEAIITFRELHGPFLTVEEMTQVKGLGKAFIAKNEHRVVFE